MKLHCFTLSQVDLFSNRHPKKTTENMRTAAETEPRRPKDDKESAPLKGEKLGVQMRYGVLHQPEFIARFLSKVRSLRHEGAGAKELAKAFAKDTGLNNPPREQVMAMQREVGVRPDGVLGNNTIDALYKYMLDNGLLAAPDADQPI